MSNLSLLPEDVTPEGEVVIEDLVRIDEDQDPTPISHPSIVSFRNGAVPTNVDAVNLKLKKRRRTQSEEQSDNKSDDGAEESQPELFAHARAGKMWHATPGFNDVNCNYYIGVRRKSTGTIRLVQANSVYSLRPYVNPEIGAQLWDEMDEQDRDVEQADPEAKNFFEKRQELLDSFGGKRAKIQIARYERNRITDDKVDEKTVVQINEAAKEMIAKDTAQGISHSTVETSESTAPPHNNTASSPEDAYPLLGLISPQELNALEDVSSLFVQGIEDNSLTSENPGWHPLVWKMLRSIIAVGDTPSEERMKRIQCVMHLHYLITLSRTTTKIKQYTRASLMEDMAVDEGILFVLLERFTSRLNDYGQPNIRAKTAEDSEKIIKYAIVMWMHALGFSNCGMLDELADALDVSLKSLLAYAIGIGCKARKHKESNGPQAFHISLKVPLIFPSIRKRKQMQNRRLTM